MAQISSSAGDFNWEFLIDRIVARKVIPVIGREVYQIDLEDRTVSLDRYLAERLAAGTVARDTLSQDFDLNEVSMALFAGKTAAQIAESKSALKRSLAAILEDPRLKIPAPLAKLAAITDFEMFVTMGFDDLLEQAIDAAAEARSMGSKRTRGLAFFAHAERLDLSENECNQLADQERKSKQFELRLDSPLVYHPFGVIDDRRFAERRRRRSVDFALTEEELLERLLLLQTEQRRPKNMFDLLGKADLLFIGCGLPDGLARLLIRTLANERLRGHQKIYKVADTWAAADSSLNLFLRHCDTEVIEQDPLTFVDELYTNWKILGTPLRTALPEGKIFLSYQSGDRERVANFKAALEHAGLDVWFDQKEIGYGDDWRETIRRGIDACRLFVPFISERSRKPEGVFREEWQLANKRTGRQFGAGIPFLVPVVLDDTPLNSEGFPPTFWEKHVYCPEGNPDETFINRLVEMLQEAHLR